jgi:glycosyltransferase 2 family protein
MATAPEGPPKARRLVWKEAALVGATVAVVAVLVARFGGAGGLAHVLVTAEPRGVAAAFVMSAACVMLGTLRWQQVVRAMGHRLGFGRALEVVLATWPLGVATPSRAADFARAWAVRDVVPIAPGAGSVLAEKAIDLLVLLGLAAAGAAAAGLWPWLGLALALLAAEVTTVALATRHREWLSGLPLLRRRAQAIRDFFLAFDALRRAPGRLAFSCILSLAVRLLTIGVTYALLVAVGADVSALDTAATWPLATLVGLAPVTLGGMGTRDAAFLLLLAERGRSVEQSAVLAATIGYAVIAQWSFALVGLPLMWREARRPARPGSRSTAAETSAARSAADARPDERAPGG